MRVYRAAALLAQRENAATGRARPDAHPVVGRRPRGADLANPARGMGTIPEDKYPGGLGAAPPGDRALVRTSSVSDSVALTLRAVRDTIGDVDKRLGRLIVWTTTALARSGRHYNGLLVA